MKLGIGSYTLTWSVGIPKYEKPESPLTMEQLIHIAHDNGLELVQIADNVPLHLLSDEELDDILRTAQKLNVTLEIGTRGTAPQHLLKYAEIAQKLNCTLLRTIITEPETTVAEAHIREVLPQLEAFGIVLAIENHGLHTTHQLAGLFDRLNSPFAGCCLDTVNSFSALESPDQVIQALLPYVVNLHVKDFEIKRAEHQLGFIVQGAPAGKGRLDIPGLLALLNKLGKQPNVILELWTPYAGTIGETVRLEQAWLEESLDYLKQFPFHTSR
ncbi:sugar phosphate isomerase/epimerase family protein [Paenibacillus thalictri]|uniref:Sugar phosphate isomerase/epimerase n=1 Tax=Paenibacillus thalictri TaxID=2527873 RepID=A0A4Q9DQE8_9BACL|nr:sugar phosphate isomerase/epimerase family protein [Paenibacillus thalictri]TBL76526.1 sugar phosphate isomerase/epimerase [Paenibacillus thalictri]